MAPKLPMAVLIGRDITGPTGQNKVVRNNAFAVLTRSQAKWTATEEADASHPDKSKGAAVQEPRGRWTATSKQRVTRLRGLTRLRRCFMQHRESYVSGSKRIPASKMCEGELNNSRTLKPECSSSIEMDCCTAAGVLGGHYQEM